MRYTGSVRSIPTRDSMSSDQMRFSPVRCARPWHRDDDHAYRLELTKHVMKLLSQRKLNPTKGWMSQLPHKARRLEEQLYQSANSLDAYINFDTLKNRLRNVAIAISRKYRRKERGATVLRCYQQQTKLDALNMPSTQEQVPIATIRPVTNSRLGVDSGTILDDKSANLCTEKFSRICSTDMLATQQQQILTLLKKQKGENFNPMDNSNLEKQQIHLQEQQLLLDKLAQTMTLSTITNDGMLPSCQHKSTDLNNDWADPTDISSSSLPYSLQLNDEDALEVQFIRETFGEK